MRHSVIKSRHAWSLYALSLHSTLVFRLSNRLQDQIVKVRRLLCLFCADLWLHILTFIAQTVNESLFFFPLMILVFKALTDQLQAFQVLPLDQIVQLFLHIADLGVSQDHESASIDFDRRDQAVGHKLQLVLYFFLEDIKWLLVASHLSGDHISLMTRDG